MTFIGDNNINWDKFALEELEKEIYQDVSIFDYFAHLLKLGMKVLDLGCNISRWNILFKKLGLIYEGLDASLVAISIAKTRFPENTYYFLRVEEMNFVEKYDLVFCNTMLQHTNIEAKKKIIPLVWQALKKMVCSLSKRNVMLKLKPLLRKKGGLIS